jgi:hypothetical protein
MSAARGSSAMDRAGTAARRAMSAADLTEAMIAAAMTKADARVCVPGDTRCYAFPSNVDAARATCTAKGRCKVGWVVRVSGRESWDVSVEVRAGLVKLIPRM